MVAHDCKFFSPSVIATLRDTRITKVKRPLRAVEKQVDCEAIEEKFEPDYILDGDGAIILFRNKRFTA